MNTTTSIIPPAATHAKLVRSIIASAAAASVAAVWSVAAIVTPSPAVAPASPEGRAPAPAARLQARHIGPLGAHLQSGMMRHMQAAFTTENAGDWLFAAQYLESPASQL